MNLQQWDVFQKIDGNEIPLGTVTTSMDGTQVHAVAKAWRRFVGREFTIGWELVVKKGEVRRVEGAPAMK